MKWPFVTRARYEDTAEFLRVSIEERQLDRSRWEARYLSLAARLDVAHERLYAAWKDGFQIPPEPTPPPEPLASLPSELQGWIQQWEGEKAQGAAERKVRSMLKGGMTPAAVILELDEPRVPE